MGVADHGLLLKCPNDMTLFDFADEDWASYLDDRKSTYEFCVFLGGNLIVWLLQKLLFQELTLRLEPLSCISCCINGIDSFLIK